MSLNRMLRKAESVTLFDRTSTKLTRAVHNVLAGTRTDAALRGSWLGHPLHPLVVTVPIGAWVCSAALDLTGQREAARELVGIGLALTPPAVAAGVADLSHMSLPQRRVGALHAAANTVAAACYLVSHRRRSAGAHTEGMVWGMLGLLAVGAGGALGGHLTYALGAGVYQWQGGSRPDH
ncbi:DUF2231 domain-containing protein [Saccharomonospora marina]|nr:DUF2231 domain-containing protein [Saccharomonospora marina]